MQVLYSYISYTGFCLEVLFFFRSLEYYQSFMRNQEGKNESQKKVHKRICEKDITFLTAHPVLYIFCCFLCLFSPPFQVRYLWNDPYIVLLWLVFCEMTSLVSGWKYENLLQFNNSWLASLRMWYYFRLCFNFSCSGYDLTLTKKSHALNCYSFLRKFLLKRKTYKLVVGNCVSSIYC